MILIIIAGYDKISCSYHEAIINQFSRIKYIWKSRPEK